MVIKDEARCKHVLKILANPSEGSDKKEHTQQIITFSNSPFYKKKRNTT